MIPGPVFDLQHEFNERSLFSVVKNTCDDLVLDFIGTSYGRHGHCSEQVLAGKSGPGGFEAVGFCKETERKIWP